MKQAMIFAAGLGTRLRPLTDSRPKALVEVGGRPLLWHVLMRLKAAGTERVVVNVHHFARQIVDYIEANGDFGMDIRISDETSMLLETGGGIKRARALLDGESPVLIHNVDILSNADLSQLYAAAGRETDAVLLVSNRQTRRYLLFSADMRLVGWTHVETGEVRSPYDELRMEELCRLAFSGIHVLGPSLFPLMDEWPDRFPIIDFYLRHCRQQCIRGLRKDDLQLMDVGKQETLAQAADFLKRLAPQTY